MKNKVESQYYRNLKLAFKMLKLVVLFLGATNVLAEPQIITAKQAEACQYLAGIEGDSGYGKKYNWQGFAKYNVMQQAKKMDATHVVWEAFKPVGGFNGIALAKAYRCSAKE